MATECQNMNLASTVGDGTGGGRSMELGENAGVDEGRVVANETILLLSIAVDNTTEEGVGIGLNETNKEFSRV